MDYKLEISSNPHANTCQTNFYFPPFLPIILILVSNLVKPRTRDREREEREKIFFTYDISIDISQLARVAIVEEKHGVAHGAADKVKLERQPWHNNDESTSPST